MKKMIIAGILTASVFFACQKQNTQDEQPVSDTEKVGASVTGIVVSETNVPISGATVTCGSQTTTTDAYGIFRFNNIQISKNNGWVKITKPGYFNGNRTFITTAGRVHNLRIKLLSKATAGTFSAAAGGSISLTNGSKITIAANSISDAAGNAYAGTVNVAMRWLDPLAKDLQYSIPGDLRGISINGTEKVLETYGMLGVELSGSSGQELKITNGKTAELSFPLPAAMVSTAPASIPLWFFDETSGRWKEEGSAVKTGNAYVGTVKHFTFWNCDAGFPLVNLCINLTGTNGQPLNNTTVWIHRVNNPASVGYGQTDSLGNVCGGVPKNEALVLAVLDNCGTPVYTQNIGPFSANASLNITVNIPPVNTLTITGTLLNCNNTPVVNGYARIYTANGYSYSAPVNTSGQFSLSIMNCAGNLQFSVLGVDNAAQQQGTPVAASGVSGTVNVGNISACGTSVSQYINLLVDGVPYNWAPPDSLLAFYGNGTLIGITIDGVQLATPSTINRCEFSIGPFNVPGTYPMKGSIIIIPTGTSYVLQNPATAVVNVTEYGSPVTGFVAGNYNENYIFQPGSVIRNVICSFRVRRP